MSDEKIDGVIGETVIEHNEDGTDTVTHLPVEEELFEDSAIVDRVPAPPAPPAQPAVPEKPKKNALGTQDFCPMKDKCNHRARIDCQQMKLETDHKAACGPNCVCFNPARGVMTAFHRPR
jgi:hypothetical protein